MARPLHERLTDRLATLILESESPQQAMREVVSQLGEAGMGDHLPGNPQDARELAEAAIGQNYQLREGLPLHRVSLTDLDRFETPEQLINSLLPASSE